MTEPRQLVVGRERVFMVLSDRHDGLSTRARSGELESLYAQLVLPNLQAESHVHLGPTEIQDDLPRFFEALAFDWRGWTGTRTWTAYEGGLRIDANNDGRGHVALTVELRQRSSDGWLVAGDIPLDAGQLDQVARDVAAFFNAG